MSLIIKQADGSYERLPARDAIQTEDGVYYTYDVDPYPTDFELLEDAEIVGRVRSDADSIDAPVTPDWLTQFTSE